MSDLTATNCGCGCNDGGNSCCSIIWILVLLSLLNNGDNGCGCNGALGANAFGDNGCLLLLLLLCCCGNGNF